MDRVEVVRELKAYVVREILEGDESGLDERSPLLDWGVFNSLEIQRLLGFVGQQFGVAPQAKAVTPESFKDIGAIADLVVESTPVGEDRSRER